MSLSIGQLMKGLLGDVQPGDSKALELKVGQIVRGVLVKMLNDQEAVIQINGTQVQAKLETPLQPGQSTLLQVQPQSVDGMLVLKLADQQTATMNEASLKEWLKASGLPEQKWTQELVRDLRREGGTLTRETASQFKQALTAMPQGSDAQAWAKAAALANKRGLPMTSATIGALAQTLSGTPAHTLLESLEQGLAAWSGASSAGGEAAGDAAQPPSAAQAAAAKLQTLLREGAALMRAAPGGAGAQPAPGPAGAAGSAAAPAPAARSAAGDGAAAGTAAPSGGGAAAAASAQPAAAPRAAPPITPGGGAAKPASPDGAAHNHAADAGTTAPSPQPAGSSSNWVGQMMKWLGVDHERLLAAAVTEEQQQAVKQPEQLKQSSDPAIQTHQENKAVATSQSPKDGLDRNAVVAGLINDRVQLQQGNTSLPTVLPSSDSLDAVKNAADESMKSALMTLASSDDVPPALRDTAQQLVSHITGQQLLLSPEKTSSLLSHVTMFIPMHGQDGGQTASVHIQTRRGRKGELDADNCRLLFDLRMKSLGDTVVDVQVVDKIVSLNLWNDHPMAGSLIETSRAELSEALQRAGYQLLSLKATPMPERMAERMNASETMAAGPGSTEWSTKPYKGVDYRV
ncbi:flagellar hook-length control protein FliK [Paenibacillus sp. CF384]|uniref:flagellar hook-length control protein FliK n=1 Tax=Paenibacillus sp. CF384 TaxID=1884382 RepID=UPI00089C1713|nr:flagellar hook-length control protein FliK [Paenibacillus sp. CF384]SDW28148.1 hook-length control protein FliK [Paenibacillus sp. CF384]